jgi:hypothetical protein
MTLRRNDPRRNDRRRNTRSRIEASKEDNLMALRLGLEMEEEMLQMKQQENFNRLRILKLSHQVRRAEA